EFCAGVERKARRTDRRDPDHSRVLHAGAAPRLIGDERAGVVPAHRDERPSIVLAWSEDVELVAPHRADLGLPEFARLGMKRETVTVAVSVREDLWFRARAAHERIVPRHAAIVLDAPGLPDMVAEILPLHPKAVVVVIDTTQPVTVADGHIQRAVGPEHHLAPKVARALPRVGHQNVADVCQRHPFETPARHGDRVAELSMLRV